MTTSARSFLIRAAVPSSSLSIMDEKPTTSAARIAARRRVVIRGAPRDATLHSSAESPGSLYGPSVCCKVLSRRRGSTACNRLMALRAFSAAPIQP